MKRFPAALTAILLAIAVTGEAARSSVPAGAFDERLSNAESIARNAAATPSPSAMRAVRAAIGLPVDVVYSAGDHVDIERDDLLASLPGRRAGDFTVAAAHIEALRANLRRSLGVASIDRALLGERLSRAYEGIAARPGWVERARRAIGSAIQSLLIRLLSYSGAGSVVAWVAVAALLASVLWSLSRALVPERRVRERRAREPERVDWRRISAEAIARGDEAEAVRAHYRLLLQNLAAKGILLDSPSLTAGECRRIVGGARPRLLPPVRQATDVFERVAYGEQGLRPGDLDVMERAEADVRAG